MVTVSRGRETAGSPAFVTSVCVCGIGAETLSSTFQEEVFLLALFLEVVCGNTSQCLASSLPPLAFVVERSAIDSTSGIENFQGNRCIYCLFALRKVLSSLG